MSDEPESLTSDLRAVKPKFLTRTTFIEFNLPAEVLSGVSEAGFTYCTPIQAQTLPVSLAGRDVAGQAQTGTGKTAAFLVTIFARLLALTDREPGLPAALIVPCAIRCTLVQGWRWRARPYSTDRPGSWPTCCPAR